MENKYKKFNLNFFKKTNLPIHWFDKDGIVSFPNYVVRLTIDDVGTHNNYNGYWVEIIHKTNCLISKKFFRFVDHLEMIHRDNEFENCHVWHKYDEFDWYISRPKDTKPMVDVIERWIEFFVSMPSK